MGETLVKSKERVQKFGEVFTPANIVNDMLSMDGVNELSYQLGKCELEPTCGNGNFLVQMLDRKLKTAKEAEGFENVTYYTARALCDIYGIDIQADNVTESRARLKDIVIDLYNSKLGASGLDETFEKVVDFILENNIIVGNALQGDQVLILEYTFNDTAKTVGIKQLHLNDTMLDERAQQYSADYGVHGYMDMFNITVEGDALDPEDDGFEF